nr:MAG TPA: hypothetical protein [Caudoviricetes sp.]
MHSFFNVLSPKTLFLFILELLNSTITGLLLSAQASIEF